jgi:hypothetical protein
MRLRRHTVARHVGKTNRELAERLKASRTSPRPRPYTDLKTAEAVVGAALDKERSRIATVGAERTRRTWRCAIWPGSGRSADRGSAGKMAPNGCFQAVIVLRWTSRAAPSAC